MTSPRDPIIQFIKFSSVGILNTGIHLISAFFAIEFLGAPPATGNAVAFLIANISSFIMNSSWTFSHRMSIALYIRFLFVSLIGLLISWTSVLAAQSLELNYSIGILSSVFLVATSGYILNKKLVFRRQH